MPTDVYEDELLLEVELLEALPPEPGSPLYRSSYPLPALRRTGRSQSMATRVVVIENPYLRVTVAPQFGGRILRLLDKRTGIEVLGDSPRLELRDGGPRGVLCLDGIRWSAADGRLDHLGPVDYQLVEPPDEESPAGLWMFSSVPGTAFSVHVALSVPPDGCEVKVEIQTYNRSFGDWPARPQVTVFAPGAMQFVPYSEGVCCYSTSSRSGLQFKFDPYELRHVVVEPEKLRIARTEKPECHSKRTLQTWSFSLLPLSGLGTITAVSPEVAMGLGAEALEICSNQLATDAKVVLATDKGQVLEAPVQISPETVASLDVKEVGGEITAVGLISESRKELLRWEKRAEPIPFNQDWGLPLYERDRFNLPFFKAKRYLGSADPERLEKGRHRMHAMTTDPAFRSAAYVLLGLDRLWAGDLEMGSAFIENALLYNGEDVLTWWLKAAIARLAGGTEVERPELLNAHFLAPLEPMLRAESFLSAPENIKLLEPFKNDPSAMIEVACILYDCRMYADLSHWIRACLTLKDVAMLRYILAAALLQSTNMAAEAAGEIRLAAALPIEPPYPWAPTQVRILNFLLKRFPEDERLQEWRKLTFKVRTANA